MNETYLSGEDQRLLDLLVDGELNDADRRELLLRLERAPDGWRRCAAAFLEAQAWRGEARAMVTAPAAPSERSGRPQPASLAGARSSVQIWMPLALAAGLLVATTWVFWNRNADGPVGPGLAGNPPQKVPALSGNNGPGSRINPGPATSPQSVQLVVDGGADGQRNVEVPLVDAAQMDEALFGQFSPALPPEMIRFLEQNGHQVVRERQLRPYELRDGRRIVVPVDQVEIRPVNVQSFQ
jgi:predicted RNA binding protein YcfA (HicA-like mRNA interferase family)